jgi:hypothetical protein
MSISQHPVALRLEERVGRSTRLLAMVMGLPLLDGIFIALLVSGALDSTVAIIEAGLLIFGGSATVAVILAESDPGRRQQLLAIAAIGGVLVPVAIVQATLASSLSSIIDFAIFQRFAGVVILAIAAKTASAAIGRILPAPAAIIGLGLLASVEFTVPSMAANIDTTLMLTAAATAGVGVVFALGVAAFAPQLRQHVDLERFRFGSAIALGMLALDIVGVIPTEAPVALGVLVVTALLAYTPAADEQRSTAAALRSQAEEPQLEARAPWL